MNYLEMERKIIELTDQVNAQTFYLEKLHAAILTCVTKPRFWFIIGTMLGPLPKFRNKILDVPQWPDNPPVLVDDEPVQIDTAPRWYGDIKEA